MSFSNENQPGWYVLHVRTNRERAVMTNLADKGFEVYVPLMKEQRRYSQRIREVQVPCFPGYLFCRLDLNDRLSLLKSPDVYRLLGTAKKAECVPDAELDTLRRVVDSGLSVQRCPFPLVGDVVQIGSGSLAGMEGVLLKVKNGYRVIVSINLLRRSVSVEIESASIYSFRKLGQITENTSDIGISQNSFGDRVESRRLIM